ncbi:MAG: hypothetical protein F6K26_19765 [Moorea sp. SIO2I5]|nr:hypothetical protein [Moorena sp. SIO2I5]
MAFRPRDRSIAGLAASPTAKAWPTADPTRTSIAFNLGVLATLGRRPRQRRTRTTLAFGHAIAFNLQPINLQPINLQPSTNQPSTFNQSTFNQPTFNQPTLAFRPRNRVQPIGRVIINSVP